MVNESVKVSGGFCLTMALVLLVVPFEWLLAAILAACFHELCHYSAIRMLCGKCSCLKLYSYAAHMPLPEMSSGREMLCALAGPIGAFSLLLFARWMPKLAICAAMQSLYNLLPIYPLDGGRALRSGMLLFLSPPKAKALCRVLELLCKAGISGLAVYGCFWLKLGIFPLLMAALLFIRVK